jgi:DNA (cytosine-5)-methyltransferase 1
MKKKKLVAWSLFSGCGGLDLGFEEAGIHIEAAHDIDPVAVQSYNENLRSTCYETDISSSKFLIPKGLDIVLSGSPCQGFSLAGKREVDDPRNSLLIHTSQLIASAKPRVVLFENVPGALSGEMKDIWNTAVSILEKAGYHVKYEVLPLSDYGVPQMRKRVFLLAFLKTSPPTLSQALKKSPSVTLGSILSGAQKLNSGDIFSEFEFGSLDWAIAQRILPGMKLCDVRAGERSVHSWAIPEVFGPTSLREQEMLETVMRLRRQLRRRKTGDADPVQASVLKKIFGTSTGRLIDSLTHKNFLTNSGDFVDLRRRFNGKYRRGHVDFQSYTVDTTFGNPRYFLHPFENRGFSAREAARIQTFPDHFNFSGSSKDQFRMIGNAVPPLISKRIAFALKQSIAS